MIQRHLHNLKLKTETPLNRNGPFSELNKFSRLWKIKIRKARRVAAQKNEVVMAMRAPAASRTAIANPLRWYLPLDIAALVAAFLIAWGMATVMNDFAFHRSLYNTHNHGILPRILQYSVISCGVLLNFEYRGHYRLRMPFWLETRGILVGFCLALAIDGFLQFASKQDFSRASLVTSWGLAAALIIVSRGSLRAVLRKRGLWQVPTLLVGSGTTGEDARTAIKSEPCLGYAIVDEIEDLPRAFWHAQKSWKNLCERHKADYVVIALDGVELAQAEESIAQLIRENIPFSISPPMRHMPVFGMVPHYFFNHDVMLLTHNRGLEHFLPRLIKRGFDIFVSACALLLLSPIMLVIAGIVRTDGGPIFYGHKRVGCKGRSFSCLKFRTMRVDGNVILEQHLATFPEALDEWYREQKLRKDPRITRAGHFLRSSSLDELPQLFNVLCGHMSLVGPRPIVKNEADKYDDDIAYYYRVRPGITGLWQVSGRNDVSYTKRVHMDAWYVRNWSLWHDITIICKTFPVLLMRAGAY